MSSDEFTARALREAAALIAEVRPAEYPWLPRSYDALVGLVAVAWMSGHQAALGDQLGGDAA